MQRVFQYFGIAMGLVYLTVGLAIILGANNLFHIPDQFSMGVGIILIAYGVYRTYRIYKAYMKDRL
jgi:hypothetical protein